MIIPLGRLSVVSIALTELCPVVLTKLYAPIRMALVFVGLLIRLYLLLVNLVVSLLELILPWVYFSATTEIEGCAIVWSCLFCVGL